MLTNEYGWEYLRPWELNLRESLVNICLEISGEDITRTRLGSCFWCLVMQYILVHQAHIEECQEVKRKYK